MKNLIVVLFVGLSLLSLTNVSAHASEPRCSVALEGDFVLTAATVKTLLAKKGYDVVEAGQAAPCSVVSGGYSEADGDYKGMDLVDRTNLTVYKRLSTLTKKMGIFFVHRQFEKVELRFFEQVLPECDKLGEGECRVQ